MSNIENKILFTNLSILLVIIVFLSRHTKSVYIKSTLFDTVCTFIRVNIAGYAIEGKGTRCAQESTLDINLLCVVINVLTDVNG